MGYFPTYPMKSTVTNMETRYRFYKTWKMETVYLMNKMQIFLTKEEI